MAVYLEGIVEIWRQERLAILEEGKLRDREIPDEFM